MERNTSQAGIVNRGHAAFSATPEQTNFQKVVKSHCWYCNKPLYGVRHYCGQECREAIFEDNDFAKQRRLIFGCQC